MRRVCSALVIIIAAAGLGAQQSPAPGGATGIEQPDETRFTPVVVVSNGELDEPMAFEVTPDERVYIIERKGGFKVYDPVTKTVKLIATFPVNTKYISASGVIREAEEGLIGLTLDPNFEQNRWIYLLYADVNVSKHVLARWELGDDTFVPGSKKVVLEYTTQRETCCHTGGGMHRPDGHRASRPAGAGALARWARRRHDRSQARLANGCGARPGGGQGAAPAEAPAANRRHRSGACCSDDCRCWRRPRDGGCSCSGCAAHAGCRRRCRRGYCAGSAGVSTRGRRPGIPSSAADQSGDYGGRRRARHLLRFQE